MALFASANALFDAFASFSSSVMYSRRFMRERCADWRLARMRLAFRGSSWSVSKALARAAAWAAASAADSEPGAGACGALD